MMLRLQSSFDSSRALAIVSQATNDDYYIFGGTIRHVLLNEKPAGDLDLIISNHNNSIYEAFAKIGLNHTLNSKGHHRYQWNKLQIDVCQPKEFFSGFETVNGLLSHVDLKLNAVAFHVKTNSFLDPFEILQQKTLTDPGINWDLWNSSDKLNLTVVSIRLARLLFDSRNLKLNYYDATKLIRHVIPIIKTINWDLVKYRFPEGKEAFIRFFTKLIHERSKV